MRTFIVVIFLFAVSSPTIAQSPDPKLNHKQIEAFSKLQMEYTTCAAYYNFVIRCAPESMEANTAKQFKPAIGYITMMQYYLGNMIGLTQDEVMSRYKLAVEDQMNVTHKSCENISSLYDRHTTRCKQLVEPRGSESVLKEYLKK